MRRRWKGLEHVELAKKMIAFCKETGRDTEFWEDELVRAKRAYRAYLREDEERKKVFDGVVVNRGGDWDYYWRKVFFKGEHWTDEKKDQFRAAVWKPYKPTYYDCTGQIFTAFVDIFNVPSGVVAYIREDMDI